MVGSGQRLSRSQRRLGRFTRRTLPLLPPPQKNESLPSLSSPEMMVLFGGIATLIVDRDYRKVLSHSDRALVLQKGRVVLQGDAATVAADPGLAGCLGV